MARAVVCGTRVRFTPTPVKKLEGSPPTSGLRLRGRVGAAHALLIIPTPKRFPPIMSHRRASDLPAAERAEILRHSEVGSDLPDETLVIKPGLLSQQRAFIPISPGWGEGMREISMTAIPQPGSSQAMSERLAKPLRAVRSRQWTVLAATGALRTVAAASPNIAADTANACDPTSTGGYC